LTKCTVFSTEEENLQQVLAQVNKYYHGRAQLPLKPAPCGVSTGAFQVQKHCSRNHACRTKGKLSTAIYQ